MFEFGRGMYVLCFVENEIEMNIFVIKGFCLKEEKRYLVFWVIDIFVILDKLLIIN